MNSSARPLRKPEPIQYDEDNQNNCDGEPGFDIAYDLPESLIKTGFSPSDPYLDENPFFMRGQEWIETAGNT